MLPVAEGDQQNLPAHLRVLHKGDLVQVELHSGRFVNGEVVEAQAKSCFLGRASNYGYQETTVASKDIKSIRLGGGATAGDAAKGAL